MINEYVDCTEFMRLIEDQKIKPSALKRYLKEQGMIFTATNAHELAKSTYTIFMGCNELEHLQQIIVHESNYEKSVLLNSDLSTDCDEDILVFFADEFNKMRTSCKKDISIEQPIISGDTMYLKLTYTKSIPGKNRFLKDSKRIVQIQIRKKNRSSATIDIRQQSSTDYQRVLELFSTIAHENDSSGLEIKHINLQALTPKNRVAFFDELAARKYPNWTIKTITGITVKKIASVCEDDEEELTMDDQGIPSGTLAGINQAVLHGSGLRSNEFVQSCIDQGFEITSMKYRYESKQEATEFIVSISSKSEDLRVDIDKSYIEEDGRFYHQPLPKSDQDEIIQIVQKEVNAVYKDLRQTQQNAAEVEGIVVPVTH